MNSATSENEREAFVNEHLGIFGKLSPNSQARNVAVELAREAFNQSRSDGIGDEVTVARIAQAMDLLKQVQWILNPLTESLEFWSDNPTIKKEREERNTALRLKLSEYENRFPPELTIWRFPVAKFGVREGADNRHSWFVNREELANLSAEYVSSNWMKSSSLERILVHAFVYAEAHGFAIAIRPRLVGMSWFDSIMHPLKPGDFEKKQSRRALFAFVWVMIWYALVIAIGVAAWSDTGKWWIGAGLSLGFYFLFEIWYRLQTRDADQARERIDLLNSGMLSVSEDIAKSPVSLRFVRERLITLAEKGASWDGAVFAILDKARRRGQVTW